MHTAVDPDDFLNEFMGRTMPIYDEVGNRCLTDCDFGQELGNEENDVPLYDQYNRGLALTQQERPRTNLALEGNECSVSQRPGLTGYIPSVEEGIEMGANPLPKGAVLVNMRPGKKR